MLNIVHLNKNKLPNFVRWHWVNSDASSAVQETNNRFKSLVFLRCIFLLLTLFCLQPAFATPTTPTSDFINNGDGTVTHKTTGLTWMRCVMGQTWTGSTCSGAASTYTYDQAVALKSNFAGHGDWRLPNIAELHTIVERDDLNFEIKNPVINTTIFPNTPGTWFWSSSPPHADSTSYTWIVNFESNIGLDGFGTKDQKNAVRLVRGGQTFGSLPFTTPSSDFTNNNDGTVTHKRTGLTWQRCSVGQTWTGSSCSGTAKHYTHEQGVTLTSNFAGYNDWRVPNQNELLSIVEYGTYNPAINLTLFPNTHSDHFLSSSPYRHSQWIVDFSNGQGGFYDDTYDSNNSVRLVRGGEEQLRNQQSLSTILSGTPNQVGSWDYKDPKIANPPIKNLWGYDDTRVSGSRIVQNATSYFNPINSMSIVVNGRNRELAAYPNVDQFGNYNKDGAFQCTALISQYLSLLGFDKAPTDMPDGKDVVNTLTRNFKGSFTSVDNKIPPMVGSIISMDAGSGGTADSIGHVAIVKGVTNINENKIVVNLIEQNIRMPDSKKPAPPSPCSAAVCFAVDRTVEFKKAADGTWSATHTIAQGGPSYNVLNWTTPVALPKK